MGANCFYFQTITNAHRRTHILLKGQQNMYQDRLETNLKITEKNYTNSVLQIQQNTHKNQ